MLDDLKYRCMTDSCWLPLSREKQYLRVWHMVHSVKALQLAKTIETAYNGSGRAADPRCRAPWLVPGCTRGSKLRNSVCVLPDDWPST